jgi:hypothetical protein
VYLVAKNKPLPSKTSPTIIVGLFCIALLLGCQPPKPEEVTMSFWQAIAQGQLEIAKKFATQNSQQQLNPQAINPQQIDKNSTITTGAVVGNDLNAVVETTFMRTNKPVTFNTVLLKEKDGWKVDYQQTRVNISMVPFDGIVKSLQGIGDAFTQQLEQSVPIIEKEMESFGNELKKQLDEFGRSLKKPQDPNNPKAHPGTI